MTVAALSSAAHAQLRVVNWNVAKLAGDPVAVENVFAAIADDDRPGFAVAPAIIAVNPASLLGSKMVKEAYGTPGKDIGIGAQILVEAALDPRFADATGRYFDNDRGQFASPHPDALDPQKNEALVALIDDLVAQTTDA